MPATSIISGEDNLSYQKATSIPYLVFLYQDELRARGQVMTDPEYKYEIKYTLTDELVHTNFIHARKFTHVEVGHMQDSVIYKKRLRLTIANIRNKRKKSLKKIGKGVWI